MRTADINSRLATLSAEAADLKRQRDENMSKRMLKCRGCGKRFRVSNLTFIQTHWYTPPRGCTGGDYWNEGEGQWKCRCGHVNRQYHDPTINELKRFFGSREDTYDD